ncbi:MAG: YbhB/YbcL family Raf kinase inhibitor-like protein [Methanomassiliicoccaceae archaeon]|jgi:Raf kinase inhibitor-like YbhB/YbcL family protein|nr:YbhB/YbcL family Raf kinase inhibitor-like protein [Methanomassiliicoccaceae archaeon]
MPLTVKSPAFGNEGQIPKEHTGHGDDMSPELNLDGTDDRAVSIAITMDDLGVPIIKIYNHWVIWNIPVVATIPAGIPHGAFVECLPGAVQGKGYGKNRYRGPKPPFNRSHRYQFTVFVLDSVLDLSPETGKRGLLKAMEGHVIQKAALTGRYR